MKWIKKIFTEISEKKFYRNFFILSGSTVIAQGLNILLSPIISRLFTPDELGVLTLFTTLITVLSISITLKYEWAIPIAKNDEEAKRIVKLCVYILLFMVIIISLIFIIFKKYINQLADLSSIEKFLFFIPIGLILVGLYNILVQWALRMHNFKELSVTKITQSLFQNIVKILGGLFKFGVSSLIVGRIVGQSIGINPLLKSYKKINLTKLSFKEKISTYKNTFIRYINFALFSAPSQLINTLGIQLPSIIISFVYGINEVGLYGLAYSVVSLPMSIIGVSIGDTFYAEVSKSYINNSMNKDNIISLEKKLFKQLVFIGLIPMLILLFFGPILFKFIYGNEWIKAGMYAKIIGVLVFFRLIFTPITKIFSVFEKQKIEFLLDIFRLLLTGISFYLSYLFKFDSLKFLTLYTFSMVIVYFVSYCLAKKLIYITK